MHDLQASRIRPIAERRQTLVESLRQDPAGLSWCELHSDLIDEAIREIYEAVRRAHPDLPHISIVGVGGYGRRELAPYSDIDIVVIPIEETHPALDVAVKELYFHLHEAFRTQFGLEPGYAYRLINDAIALDAKSQTGMLDARLVAGSHAPLQAFQGLFHESFVAGEFVLAKIREREENFRTYHDTPLVTAPHLKEGAGGIRCFHCANWIRLSIETMPARPSSAFDSVAKYRNLLHVVAGKPTDHLTWARQGELAELLSTTPNDLMSELATSMLAVHEEYIAALDVLRESRYRIAPGVMAIRGEARVTGDATLSAAAQGIAIATELGLRVESDVSESSPDVDGAEALHAISSGEVTLRNLDRSGLLDRLLPELTACRTLMPQDPTHTYSVFEHTLRVIRNLDNVPREGYLGNVRAAVSAKPALYLAALLHDTGKIDPLREHSELGAEITLRVAQRWGIASNVRDTVAWLVREHLTLDRFLRTRDVENAQAAWDFATIVQNQERLDMLTLLTYADVNAVSDTAWTVTQDSYLRVLHERTTAALEGETSTAPAPATFRRMLERELIKEDIDDDEIRAYLQALPPHYILSTPTETAKRHLQHERRAREGAVIVEVNHRPDAHTSEITVCCLDAPGLLSKILGVVYAYDVTTLGVRAATTRTDKPVAIDTLTVSFNENCVPFATERQIETGLREVIEGRTPVADILKKRGKDASRKQDQFTYTFTEGKPGILEVRAPRGRGMAYRMSQLISENAWNISTARFGQWAGRGSATFYISGKDEAPLSATDVEQALSRGV
ncbi:MAG: HD domain-containing protein [Fimbriimonadaceae bacterium]|nr:HD domain-containing protein [Fimbriimonadaceae bacterium]